MHRPVEPVNRLQPQDVPRRSTPLEAEALIAKAHALGVPRDYGRMRKLRRMCEPKHLTYIGEDIHQRPQWMTPPAARAWMRMRETACKAGIDLQIVSAFRSVEYQLGILQRKLARGQSMSEILQVSAAPGYSEHHTGRAIDISAPGYSPVEEEFEHSNAYNWLLANAKNHGFSLSYPRENPNGICYEPWHWCWHRR